MRKTVTLPDFDSLMDLYQENPAGFEIYRRQLLQEVVEQAPNAQRPALESLLIDIDTAYSAATTPLESAISAFQMLQNSTTQLHVAWRKMRYTYSGYSAARLIERVRR